MECKQNVAKEKKSNFRCRLNFKFYCVNNLKNPNEMQTNVILFFKKLHLKKILITNF